MVHPGVPKDGLLNKPATPRGPLLPKQNSHQANPKFGTDSVRQKSNLSSGTPPSLTVLDCALGINIFIFFKINTKTVFIAEYYMIIVENLDHMKTVYKRKPIPTIKTT